MALTASIIELAAARSEQPASRICIATNSGYQELVETLPAWYVRRFELVGIEHSQMAVTSRSIVEGVDAVCQIRHCEILVLV